MIELFADIFFFPLRCIDFLSIWYNCDLDHAVWYWKNTQ